MLFTVLHIFWAESIHMTHFGGRVTLSVTVVQHGVIHEMTFAVDWAFKTNYLSIYSFSVEQGICGAGEENLRTRYSASRRI